MLRRICGTKTSRQASILYAVTIETLARANEQGKHLMRAREKNNFADLAVSVTLTRQVGGPAFSIVANCNDCLGSSRCVVARDGLFELV